MTKAELVFIPSPGLTHLTSTVEAANHLIRRDDNLSITVLIMKLPNDRVIDRYTQKIVSTSSTSSRLRLVNLPNLNQIVMSDTVYFELIDGLMPHVRSILFDFVKQSSAPVAGVVVDMFCTKFVDVADELGLPTYIFFTSGAGSLGLFSYLTSLRFEHNEDLEQYKDSDAELSVQGFSNLVPAKVFPSLFVNGGVLADLVLSCFVRLKDVKGIMINTFYDLESYTIQALSDSNLPKLYPIGPILNFDHQIESSSGQSYDVDIMKWLDNQPNSSVVFLCFGSKGSFEVPQLREIAIALEKCGHRFLWSVRRAGPKGVMQLPTEYEDFGEVLPDGFLERTRETGKVIGWAPQRAVLSHSAVGGFVSHCGWNSILESVWYGVPIATFPLHAEQQLNAFQMVKELGMAEMIRLDYKRDFVGESDKVVIVGADEIEGAILRLMEVEGSSVVRQKVKETQKRSRIALLEGGSSYNAQIAFIGDVIKNLG